MRLEYFLMVDRVVSLTPGTDGDGPIAIEASSTVPGESPVFEGHFPGHPLMPGVLLIETMAQTSGFLLLVRANFTRMPFLAQVKEAKLRSFVPPGTVLGVTGELVHHGSGFAVTRAAIACEGKRVADAELVFRTMPFPAPELEAQMRARAGQIGLTEALDA